VSASTSARPNAHTARYDRQLRCVGFFSIPSTLAHSSAQTLGCYRADCARECLCPSRKWDCHSNPMPQEPRPPRYVARSSPRRERFADRAGLVSSGVGSFTLLDSSTVTGESVGNNFFLEHRSIGKKRAEECVRLLSELNEGVKGYAVTQVRTAFLCLLTATQRSLFLCSRSRRGSHRHHRRFSSILSSSLWIQIRQTRRFSLVNAGRMACNSSRSRPPAFSAASAPSFQKLPVRRSRIVLILCSDPLLYVRPQLSRHILIRSSISDSMPLSPISLPLSHPSISTPSTLSSMDIFLLCLFS
jgi:hypothetical protein